MASLSRFAGLRPVRLKPADNQCPALAWKDERFRIILC